MSDIFSCFTESSSVGLLIYSHICVHMENLSHPLSHHLEIIPAHINWNIALH